jgi:hypothetical protein
LDDHSDRRTLAVLIVTSLADDAGSTIAVLQIGGDTATGPPVLIWGIP